MAVTPSLRITVPQTYQIYQRLTPTGGAIHVAGTYTGPDRQVEVQWKNSAWHVLDSQPRNGRFAGTLSGVPVGQGTLRVRFTSLPKITSEVGMVGIGDVFVIAGQSNASSRGVRPQFYRPPRQSSELRAGMYGNDNRWKHLADPIDSVTGQVDKVSLDYTAGGSWAMHFATHYMESQNVPVGFIPCARGEKNLAQWVRKIDSNYLYGSMWKRIKVGAFGQVKAVLWFQGESDSNTPLDTYATRLSRLGTDLWNDYQVPLIPALLPPHPYPDSRGNYRVGPRMGTLKAIRENPNVLMGPALYDWPTEQDLHYTSYEALKMVGDRFWAAVSKHFYGGDPGWGPELIAASSLANTVILEFDQSIGKMTAQPSSFHVTSNRVQNVAHVGTTVLLTMESSVLDAATISYGHDNQSAQNAAIYGPTELPAIPFLDYPLS